MPDAAFREALREARRLFILHHVPHRMEYGNDNQWHRVQNSEMIAELDALLALYAERQGEVYEATDIHNRHGIRVRVIKVPPQEFGVGDRVRVTKVEEARSDCPLVGCTIIGPHDHNPTGPWQAKEAK